MLVPFEPEIPRKILVYIPNTWLTKIRPLGFALFIADTQTWQSQESLCSI